MTLKVHDLLSGKTYSFQSKTEVMETARQNPSMGYICDEALLAFHERENREDEK
jgi:hypothetical protein